MSFVPKSDVSDLAVDANESATDPSSSDSTLSSGPDERLLVAAAAASPSSAFAGDPFGDSGTRSAASMRRFVVSGVSSSS